MDERKMAIETTISFLGEELFREATLFFERLNEDDSDIVIFVSRKAYLMYTIAKKCGFVLRDGKCAYSDRILTTPNYLMGINYNDKRVILVDDTVTNGETVLRLYEQLTADNNEFKCKSITIFVFATNTENKISEKMKPEIKSVFNTHIMMTQNQLADFSLKEVNLVHALGMVYFLELPIFHSASVTPEFFSTIENCVKKMEHNGWRSEPYKITDSDEVPFYETVLLVPEKEVIPSAFTSLFECIKYSYVKHELTLDDGQKDIFYSVNFVPIKIWEYVNDEFALNFFSQLSNALSSGEHLRKYLGKLLLCNWEDDITVSNIHKSVTHILSYCLGCEFFNSLNLENIKLTQVSTDEHLDEDFIEFVKGIKVNEIKIIADILRSICNTRNNLDLPENLVPMQEELLITSENLSEYINKIKSSNGDEFYTRVFLKELMRVRKNDEALSSKIVSLSHIRKVLGEAVTDSTFRTAIIEMIETSVCSFSALHHKMYTTNWVLKALSPGENSFIALYDRFAPKYFNALNMFILGIGSYERMKSHVDKFQEVCAPLRADDEPYIDVEKVICNELNDEILFDKYYLPSFKLSVSPKHSHYDCESEAYDLGEKLAISNECDIIRK